jgi:hypothetical protein
MFLQRIVTLLLIAMGSGLTVGLLNAKQPPDNKPLLSDVPHLQNLLREEMRAVLPAMNRIISALPTGDWQTVATTAGAIHNSFIMQQKMTTADRKLLRARLPAEFVRLDQAFHQQANRLQQAAIQHDAELSVFYVSKMLGSCMQCHQRFATSRFPALKSKPQHDIQH